LTRKVDEQTFPAPLEYDADAGALKVRETAFQWGTTDWWGAAYHSKFGVSANIVAGENIATVVSRSPVTAEGSYRASNAFGVSRVVARGRFMTEGIFVREGSDTDKNMFQVDSDGVVLLRLEWQKLLSISR
jgi:hypothetical protein